MCCQHRFSYLKYGRTKTLAETLVMMINLRFRKLAFDKQKSHEKMRVHKYVVVVVGGGVTNKTISMENMFICEIFHNQSKQNENKNF